MAKDQKRVIMEQAVENFDEEVKSLGTARWKVMLADGYHETSTVDSYDSIIGLAFQEVVTKIKKVNYGKTTEILPALQAFPFLC